MSFPVDLLIDEHKLIIQAVEIIKAKITQIETSKTVNPNNITVIVDFFRTYADKYHHGKEEGILFKELSQKKLNENDNKIMNELIQEHAFARRTVTALETAKESYILGKKEELKDITELLTTLTKFYPAHIEKEDKHFFYPCMDYFSQQEQKNMLTRFQDFDQNFTNKKYSQIINSGF